MSSNIFNTFNTICMLYLLFFFKAIVNEKLKKAYADGVMEKLKRTTLPKKIHGREYVFSV